MTSPAKKTVKKTVKSPSATLEPTLEPPASPALEPKTKLSRDLILQTAAKIADRDGIQALTMRKLAQELSVEAMSIYHHVAHKNDLRDGMINLVFTEIELPPREVDWKSALRTRAVSAHAVLIRHPWAIGLLESGTVPGPATLQHHNAVLGCLREGGFSLPATAHAYSVLDGYIYGFALTEINLPFKNADDAVDIAAIMMAQMANNPYPYLAEMTTQHVLQPGYAYADEFEIGLELILDGLERWREVF
jgi:AcrR family transcriptional regulator